MKAEEWSSSMGLFHKRQVGFEEESIVIVAEKAVSVEQIVLVRNVRYIHTKTHSKKKKE